MENQKLYQKYPNVFVHRMNRFHIGFFVFLFIPLFIELVNYSFIIGPIRDILNFTFLGEIYWFVYGTFIEYEVFLFACFIFLACLLGFFLRAYRRSLKDLKKFPQFHKLYNRGRIFSIFDMAVIGLSILVFVIPLAFIMVASMLVSLT